MRKNVSKKRLWDVFNGRVFMVNPPDRHFEINPLTSPYSYRAAKRALSKGRPARPKRRQSKRRIRKVASTERKPSQKELRAMLDRFVSKAKKDIKVGKRRKSTSTGGRKMAKRRTAAQRAATRKLVAYNRKRRRGGKRSRARGGRKRAYKGRTYSAYKRTRGRRRRKLSPARRYSQRGRAPSSRVRRAGRTLRARRWALRGNPPIMMVLQQGAIDAAGVVLGEIGTNLIEGFIPELPGLSSASTVGKIVRRTGAAFAGSIAISYVPGINYQWRRMFLAGGLASVIKTGLKGVVPSLPAGPVANAFNAALGEDEGYLSAYPEALALPGMGAYPESAGMAGDEEYAYS